mgnify:CR=1 FL=1
MEPFRAFVADKLPENRVLGPEIEGRNATHQIKKMNVEQLRVLRDRLHLNDEITDEMLEGEVAPYYRPPEDSVEYQYLIARRRALDGFVPRRIATGPDGSLWVDVAGNQGSGVLRSMVEANGLIVLHHGQGNVAAGDEVDVMMFDGVI